MKKILILFVILSSIAFATYPSYRYDIVKISEKTFYLDSADATIADKDTVIFRTGTYYTELADSVYFIVEISADSSEAGTNKDSTFVQVAAEWVSPSNFTNTLQSLDATGFASQSLLGTKPVATAGSFLYVYAGTGGYVGQHVKYRLWIWLQNMKVSTKQRVKVKVFMIRTWIG